MKHSYMNYKNILTKALLITIVVISASCSNNKKGKTDILNGDMIDTTAHEQTSMSLYNISTPNEIIRIFGSNLLEFSHDYTNKPSRAKLYLDSKTQALNIGVYMTDAAYLNLFDFTAEAFTYIDAIYHLSEEIKIAHVYDEDLYKRLIDSMGNKDSLIHLSEDIFFSLFEKLVGSPRENMAALITIGSYIEIFHLSLESVGEYNPEHAFFTHIEDFYIMLEHVYIFAEHNTLDLNVESAFEYLKRIKSILEESEKIVRELDTDSHEIETKRNISEDQFNRLKAEVSSIRNEIVGIR